MIEQLNATARRTLEAIGMSKAMTSGRKTMIYFRRSSGIICRPTLRVATTRSWECPSASANNSTIKDGNVARATCDEIGLNLTYVRQYLIGQLARVIWLEQHAATMREPLIDRRYINLGGDAHNYAHRTCLTCSVGVPATGDLDSWIIIGMPAK